MLSWRLTGFRSHLLWWMFQLAYPKIFSVTSIDALIQWGESAARDPSGMISFDLTGNQERGLGKQ